MTSMSWTCYACDVRWTDEDDSCWCCGAPGELPRPQQLTVQRSTTMPHHGVG